MNDAYGRSLLKTISAQFLDEIISSDKASPAMLHSKRDQIVWEIATKIYQQSGHTAQFTLVRDVVDARVQRIMQQQSVAKTNLADQSAQSTELHSNPDSQCNPTNLKNAPSPETPTIRREPPKPLTPEMLEEVRRMTDKFGGDQHKAQIFVQVRDVICEQLSVEESEVTLDSHLSNHLGGDGLDLIELVLALEEEFDIEISDEESEGHLGIGGIVSLGCSGSLFGGSSLGSGGYSSGGEACIVRNIVELVAQKVSASL